MKKVKIRYVLLMMSLLPLFIISCNKDEDIKLDFDVTVPANWSHYILANERIVYSAERNQENEQDSVREWVIVYKEHAPAYNLLTYTNDITTKIKSPLNTSYVSTLEEKDTAINGTDFKRMISREIESYPNSYHDTIDVNRIITRYFFYEKENGYYFMMVSTDTIFYKNKPVFDGIMSSFHYKN
jgi:hypothetical protein